MEKGYQNHEILFSSIRKKYPNEIINVVGNGSQIYQQKIENIFQEKVLLLDLSLQTASL